MTKKIRVGIIGCGTIAKAHLQGYRENGVEPTAFTDVKPELAEDLAGECSNAEVFADARSMIDSGVIDAVSICSPPAFHEEAAVHALAKGIHTLCEKPLAHTIESGRRMVEAAKKSGAILMTAYRHRFLSAIAKIKQLITEGRIGPVVLLTNTFCGYAPGLNKTWFAKRAVAGGGSMLDTSSHSVDLFRFLVGEVIEQYAVMNRRMEGCDVEDTAILVVKAQNGAVGSLTSSWMAGSSVATIDIIGEKGRIFYDYAKGNQIRVQFLHGEDEVLSVSQSNGVAEEIAHFLAVLDGKESLSCSGKDGMRALEVILNNYKESIK